MPQSTASQHSQGTAFLAEAGIPQAAGRCTCNCIHRATKSIKLARVGKADQLKKQDIDHFSNNLCSLLHHLTVFLTIGYHNFLQFSIYIYGTFLKAYRQITWDQKTFWGICITWMYAASLLHQSPWANRKDRHKNTLASSAHLRRSSKILLTSKVITEERECRSLGAPKSHI